MTAPSRIAGFKTREWVLAVHGGSDARPDVEFSPEERSRRREALELALKAGQGVLETGGSSLDAVQAAVRMLEDAPDFNAGRGAELTSQGCAELDASIMDGNGRRVGAAAGVRTVKNPVDLARSIMEHSRYAFLIGEGAERFAADHGIARVNSEYFVTERRLQELHEARLREGSEVDFSRVSRMGGTVGAVARDTVGRLAAATSTGGYTNKPSGRVGDSAVIGAGTYAENGGCAVSCTGSGEYFIRNVVAHELCARIKHAGQDVRGAGECLIEEVEHMGGYGGLIAVDGMGEVATPHGTSRMAYAYLYPGQSPVIVTGDPS